jgi:hypothetical protein
MYQGLVGVAVLCGGVDEIVIDGKTGYLTRDPNPSGIADVLARAIDDRDNWRSITEGAWRHIRERCGAAKVTVSLLELFEEGLALDQPGWRGRPSKKSTKRMVETIYALTARTRLGRDTRELVAKLDRTLRGRGIVGTIHALTARTRLGRDTTKLMAKLNRTLRGRAN